MLRPACACAHPCPQAPRHCLWSAFSLPLVLVRGGGWAGACIKASARERTFVHPWARLYSRRAACACAYPRPQAPLPPPPIARSTTYTRCACEGLGVGGRAHEGVRAGAHLHIPSGMAPSSRRLRMHPSTRPRKCRAFPLVNSFSVYPTHGARACMHGGTKQSRTFITKAASACLSGCCSSLTC